MGIFAALFLITFVVGLAVLIGTAVFGELEISDADGPLGGLLSVTSASTLLFGWGASGLVLAAASDLPHPIVALLAIAPAASLLFVFRGLLLPWMARQQSNSHASRTAYIGRTGQVRVAIPADGWGEVTFLDEDGALTAAKAVTAEPAGITIGQEVYIADVDADVVHVVAITPL
ncbi:hypothetical protein [Tomitella biformata]|uniref:hypothetical protein n=1 Tax=Tomitella biformata TaxID=630403 RepID=UPI0004633D35|nr:hypothetical protein [Tomitella biformata]